MTNVKKCWENMPRNSASKSVSNTLLTEFFAFFLLVLLIKIWKISSKLMCSYLCMMVLSTFISWCVLEVTFIIVIIFQKKLLSSYHQNPTVKSQLPMELHFFQALWRHTMAGRLDCYCLMGSINVKTLSCWNGLCCINAKTRFPWGKVTPCTLTLASELLTSYHKG